MKNKKTPIKSEINTIDTSISKLKSKWIIIHFIYLCKHVSRIVANSIHKTDLHLGNQRCNSLY